MAWNVNDYKRRLRAFNVEKTTAKIIKNQQQEIIGINQDRLSFDGKNYEGKITGTYAIETQSAARISNAIRPKTSGSAYNFEWTGDFFNGMYLTYERNRIKILSKGMGLTEKSHFITSNKALGFSDKEVKIINDELIKPSLQTSFKNHLSK